MALPQHLSFPSTSKAPCTVTDAHHHAPLHTRKPEPAVALIIPLHSSGKIPALETKPCATPHHPPGQAPGNGKGPCPTVLLSL